MTSPPNQPLHLTRRHNGFAGFNGSPAAAQVNGVVRRRKVMSVRDAAELAIENARVLDLVQAMFGAISPKMRAVSLECIKGGVLLHFLLAEDSDTDREEINDVLFEFEVLQKNGIKIESSVVVSSRPEARSEMPGRWVFGRKEKNPASVGGIA